MGNEADSRIAIDFLDPLFAVIFHISFVQIAEHAPWFWDPGLIFTQPHLFHVATLALAYVTVISSWIGYHVSVKTCGINVKNPFGRWRFFFDIVLLFLYFILFVNYENFGRELRVLAYIFLTFIVWDQLKRLEWPDEEIEKQETPEQLKKRKEREESEKQTERQKRQKRRGVTVLWFIFFLGLTVFYRIHPPTRQCGCEDCLLLIAAFCGTLLYRLHKDNLWWKSALALLGYPKANV